MTPPECPICANTAGNRLLSVCEKMNGTLEPFDYAQCPACGHLHLAAPPADMSPYYATGYYSFHSRPIPAWRQWLYRWRTAAALGGGGVSGRLMNRLKPPFYAYWLEHTGLRLGHRVLDVGCGAGNLIRILQVAGLQCTGSDPFLPGDSRTPEGAQLRKADLLDIESSWDAILFNHAFEHVPNPREVLAQAARLLEPGGCIVVRIPLSDSFAFFHYGPNWVQWDAPRHLNLFTRNSFTTLAEQCGLKVETTLEDSSRMQFWGSEEYQRNIFHNSKESYGHNPHQTTFSRRQLRDFDRWSRWLNDMGAGDQATFICRKKPLGSALES
ncbi:MAG: class I SAM-dependent methyltransferase [Kiritimatiellia bacterium]|jgi:SAM-dependent methyltransferase|nr:class I SAM-dependent methyltransferase [Kiritimatiellia bacterium]